MKVRALRHRCGGIGRSRRNDLRGSARPQRRALLGEHRPAGSAGRSWVREVRVVRPGGRSVSIATTTASRTASTAVYNPRWDRDGDGIPEPLRPALQPGLGPRRRRHPQPLRPGRQPALTIATVTASPTGSIVATTGATTADFLQRPLTPAPGDGAAGRVRLRRARPFALPRRPVRATAPGARSSTPIAWGGHHAESSAGRPRSSPPACAGSSGWRSARRTRSPRAAAPARAAARVPPQPTAAAPPAAKWRPACRLRSRAIVGRSGLPAKSFAFEVRPVEARRLRAAALASAPTSRCCSPRPPSSSPRSPRSTCSARSIAGAPPPTATAPVSDGRLRGDLVIIGGPVGLTGNELRRWFVQLRAGRRC